MILEVESELRNADAVSYRDLDKLPEKSGIYAAWRKGEERCLYVGKSTNLYGRIRSHYSGQRGSDQFCLYVYDAYVHRGTPKNISTQDINKLTANWIRSNIRFKFIESARSSLDSLERSLRKKWKPMLNPIL